MKLVPINIWDDYYGEEGEVPEGEKMETHIYVEAPIDEIPLDDQRKYLEHLIKYIENKIKLSSVKLKLWLRNTREIYPTLPDSLHTIDWRIEVEGLTHKRRERLVVELNNGDLPFNVYSES